MLKQDDKTGRWMPEECIDCADREGMKCMKNLRCPAVRKYIAENYVWIPPDKLIHGDISFGGIEGYKPNTSTNCTCPVCGKVHTRKIMPE